MGKTVEEVTPIDVRTRAKELGCSEPTEFAFVPYGIENAEEKEDLALSDEAITLRKILKNEGFNETPIDDGESLETYSQKSAEAFIGTLFISYSLLEHDWDTAVAMITTIRDYYSDIRGSSEVQMTINTEKSDGESREVFYEGPAEELETALEKAREIVKDE
ncbi:hypothetical protein [Halomontanus rarus]|uniref:hypothetical protein n=1 Tax=Halomontanus rarus TaxID=3034020 RepID=UPI0023E7ED2D|nr:hypothetical protein [Halovivax sp. TS33]